jgi:4-carboxymuconolactone decarboxylase
MLTTQDAFEKGTAVRNKMTGAGIGKNLEELKAISPELQDFVVSYLFGTIYDRPGLDLKTRSICTISALIGMGQTQQLQGHIKSGLRLGLTREEVIEIILQLQVYAGLPRGLEAIRVAQKVFDEADASKKPA